MQNIYPHYRYADEAGRMYSVTERNQELAKICINYQEYVTSFSPAEALKNGTMFPELLKPYNKFPD